MAVTAADWVPTNWITISRPASACLYCSGQACRWLYGNAGSTGTTRVQFKALYVFALTTVSGSLNVNIGYINKTAICASAVINRLEVLVFVLFVGSISGNAGVTLCWGQSYPSNSASATVR